MSKISGNIFAFLQIYDEAHENEIGEVVPSWVNAAKLKGFLDFSGGGNKYTTFSAKTEETTHIFICDYANLNKLHFLLDTDDKKITDNEGVAIQTQSADDTFSVNSEKARVVIDCLKYDLLYLDDPMGLHKHLELYLKFTGGDANV